MQKNINPLRFHILVNPTVPSTNTSCACTFTQMSIRLTKMLTDNGNITYYYGTSKQNDTDATYYYPVYDELTFEPIIKEFGSYNDGRYLSNIHSDEIKKYKIKITSRYASEVEKILIKEKYKNDIVLYCYSGHLVYPVLKKYNDVVHVMPFRLGGISGGVPHLIYPTENWKKHLLSTKKESSNSTGDVIKPFFDKNDFEYKKENEKANAILYLGRIQKLKGVCVVFDLAKKRPDVDFWIAGYAQDYSDKYILIDDVKYNLEEYPNITYYGFADQEFRKKLLSDAKALIQPSQYFEPFGSNIIEAYLSGTPVIVSNTGSFNEIIEQDKTGFICDSLDDYSDAIDNIDMINSIDCYNDGLSYANENIYQKYDKYFRKLSN